jgi:hypothetical protein
MRLVGAVYENGAICHVVARHECAGNGALVDSVGCPSGNVIGDCVRVPETIVLRRLAPAIHECLSFRQSLMTWWDEKRGLCGEHSPLMWIQMKWDLLFDDEFFAVCNVDAIAKVDVVGSIENK